MRSFRLVTYCSQQFKFESTEINSLTLIIMYSVYRSLICLPFLSHMKCENLYVQIKHFRNQCEIGP
jgi:hypothetical protein